MTEKRLIDLLRVDLGEVDISDCTDVEDIFSAVITYLFEQPTVDAVEVVRCKDCKHFVSPQGVPCCDNFYGLGFPAHSGDDFCSYGERRNDG